MTYLEEVEAWRAARYRRLTAPDGWLAVVARHPLARGKSSLALPPPLGKTEVDFDGARVRVGPRIVSAEEGVEIRDLRLELFVRGDEAYLRVKDANAAARKSFDGVPHYPVDPRWRIDARFVAAAEERTIELDYEEGGTVAYRVAGEAVFQVGATEQRLLLFHDTPRPRLYLIFRDATSKDETYGAGRFLYAPLPKDGRVVLDFNQAYNPPCALNPLVTCPLVPAQNRLGARIEAGEKRPREAH
jgi:uncharacterized protein (DUF1684 family)